MKNPTVPLIVIGLLFMEALQMTLTGCSQKKPAGYSGAINEWVNGRDVSLKVSVKTIGGKELPSVDFDNRGNKDFMLVPGKCSATYEKSGVLEVVWNEERRGPVTPPGGMLVGIFTIALNPPVGDRLLELILEYGPAPDETFTFVRK